MTPNADSLAADYLRRLEHASHRLPADRRSELLQSVGEHVEHLRASTAGESARMRDELDRLGTPEEIVQAAADTLPSAPALLPRRGLGHELAAVLMLTAGSLLLPVIGWLVGVVLLWTSSIWRTGEKILGTVIWPGGLGGLFLLSFFGPVVSCMSSTTYSPDGTVTESVETCDGSVLPDWLIFPLWVVALAAPVVVAVVLYRRAARRVGSVQPSVTARR